MLINDAIKLGHMLFYLELCNNCSCYYKQNDDPAQFCCLVCGVLTPG